MPGRILGFRNPFYADAWLCYPYPWAWWDDHVFRPDAPLCRNIVHHYKTQYANRGIKSVVETVSLVQDMVTRNATTFHHATPAADFLVPLPSGARQADVAWPLATATPTQRMAGDPRAEVFWEMGWWVMVVLAYLLVWGSAILAIRFFDARRRRREGGGNGGGDNGGNDGSSGDPNRRQRRAADKSARQEQKRASRGGRSGGRGNGTGYGDDNPIPIILERTNVPLFPWTPPSTRGIFPSALGPPSPRRSSLGTGRRQRSTSLDDEQSSQVPGYGRSQSSGQGNNTTTTDDASQDSPRRARALENTIQDASTSPRDAENLRRQLRISALIRTFPPAIRDGAEQHQRRMRPDSPAEIQEQVATVEPALPPPSCGFAFHVSNAVLFALWFLVVWDALTQGYANSTGRTPFRPLVETWVTVMLLSWHRGRLSFGLSSLIRWFMVGPAALQRTAFEYLGFWSALSGLLLLLGLLVARRFPLRAILGGVAIDFLQVVSKHLYQFHVFVWLILINGSRVTLPAQEDAAAAKQEEDKAAQVHSTPVKVSDTHKNKTEELIEKLQAKAKATEELAKLPDMKCKSSVEMAPVYLDVPKKRLRTSEPLRVGKFEAVVGKSRGRLTNAIAFRNSAVETAPSNETKAINLQGPLKSTTVKISALPKQIESSQPKVSSQQTSPGSVDNAPLHSQVTDHKSNKNNNKLASESKGLGSDKKERNDSQVTSTAAMDSPAQFKVDNDKAPKPKTESAKTDAGAMDEPEKVNAELEKLKIEAKKVESQQKPSGSDDAPQERPNDAPQDNPTVEQPKSGVEYFERSFPHGWTTIETPGEDLRCGIHAVILSMMFMQHKPVPTEKNLMDLYFHDDLARAWMDNGLDDGERLRGTYLTADQLDILIRVWGEYLKPRQHLVLGIVMDNHKPYLTGMVEGPNSIVVWIHNNGKDGFTAHWSGVTLGMEVTPTAPPKF
ncbi:MAG: hypothetical protein Q9212_002992 [Teloschistes hypoglaucus]